jgi:uncharacterized lipoprotein
MAGEAMGALVNDLGAASSAGTLADLHLIVSRAPHKRAWRRLNRLASRASS